MSTVEHYDYKKECSPDSGYNVDEPWQHDAKWKISDTEDHMSYDSIYMKCPK